MTALPDSVAHRIVGGDIHVTEPLPLHGDGRAVTRAIQFLRECQGRGLRTRWEPARTGRTGRTDRPRDACRVTYDEPPPSTPYDIRTLRHLPPPAERLGEPEELTDWREGHAHGLLYHRRGPGFVSVMDRRERPASSRITLAHPDLLAAFDALHEATALDGLDRSLREAALLLAEERLVLVVAGWAVALPPRLSRWPVPCTAV